MLASNSRFNILVVRGKRRLILHRSIRDLSTALRIACEFSTLRPTKLAGLFIAETAGGGIWSVTDLVANNTNAEPEPEPEPVVATQELEEPRQASG
jgi:hypothetical protein